VTSSTAVRGVFTLALGLLLVACSPSADRRSIPPGTDRIVELSMVGMRFIPDRIEVKLGEMVAFVVTNPNDVSHEVFIGDMADQMAHHAAHMAVASAAQAQVQHDGYGIFLEPHETGVVTYHFDTAGEILLGCHLPGHWEAGMRAIVTVKP
jgi:uncharacterized cupredoxin-like copper-binding protein